LTKDSDNSEEAVLLGQRSAAFLHEKDRFSRQKAALPWPRFTTALKIKELQKCIKILRLILTFGHKKKDVR